MASFDILKQFDKAQLFRFFVDGRFHKASKYNGWIGYENRERGSVQAMLNAFSLMLDHIYSPTGLNCNYLRLLHRTCMLNVETANLKTSPGDIRYHRTGLPFFKKTTTLENLEEFIEMRRNDGTIMFHDRELRKTANQLTAKEVFNLLQKKGKVTYSGWYPNLDQISEEALEGKRSLHEFYTAKHYVQMQIVSKMEEIVARYNRNIQIAQNDDEKLETIALLVRELEILHPFPDGNCRAFACVLLTQLLIYHDFHPAILLNPNLDFEHSLTQWVDEIKAGMEKTKILLNDPQAVVFDYSVFEMSDEHREQFLTMAADFWQKIDDYQEVFVTPERLQRYTGGTWINGDNQLRYRGVGTHGTFESGYVYFATSIADWEADGRDVYADLQRRVKAGVRGIVLDNKKYLQGLDIPVLLVDDIMEAFTQTAIQTRQEANPNTILITGTEGKTGTKIQLHHLLQQQTHAHAWLNSLNTVIPIHRSLASLSKDDKVEINEVSVDANTDKTALRASIVNPDICFFSNISAEHMHVHKSIEGVVKHKSYVVKGLRDGGKVIVNSTVAPYELLLSEIQQRKPGVEIFSFGTSESDTAQLIQSQFDTEKLGWNIEARIDKERVSYFIPLFQQHAPIMSVGVLLAVKLMGYNAYKAAYDFAGLDLFESMGQVHRIKKKEGNFLFYDQSRRASISGVRSAFQDIKNFAVKGKTVALFGTISSIKGNEWTTQYHQELAELINQSDISRLYTLGPHMEIVHENLADPSVLVKHSEDLEQLYDDLMDEMEAGDLLFIQGYLRLNLSEIAKKVLRFDDEKHERSIDKSLLQDPPELLHKKLLVLRAIEAGESVAQISEKRELEAVVVEQLNSSKMTYRKLRKLLLIQFFKSMESVIQKQFDMTCNNIEIQKSGYRMLVHNEEFCNNWFNNLDKIADQPKKMLFGSFFDFGDKKYLFNVLAGSTNLHIGILRYYREEGRIVIDKMTDADYAEMHRRYDQQLPKGIKLEDRKWGHKWVTVDCGELIRLNRFEMFSACYDFANSKLFRDYFQPLLQAVAAKK